MPFMVSTTWPTTSPPLTATVEAPSASWLPCCALSAFCFTVLDSSSIEAAVSSSALACSSVRLERSLLPWAICAEAVATPSALRRTSPTIAASRVFMSCSAPSSRPVSFLPSAANSIARSPPATARAIEAASTSGRVVVRMIHSAITPATTKAAASSAATLEMVLETALPTSSAEAVIRFSWIWISSSRLVM